MAKMDTDGNLIWAVGFASGLQEASRSCVATPDGGVVVASYWKSASSQDFFLVKLDKDGNIEKIKGFGAAAEREKIFHFASTEDGGFALCGMSRSFSATGKKDAFIMKIDADWNIEWSKQLGTAVSDEWCNAILVVDDNIYAVV